MFFDEGFCFFSELPAEKREHQESCGSEDGGEYDECDDAYFADTCADCEYLIRNRCEGGEGDCECGVFRVFEFDLMESGFKSKESDEWNCDRVA